MDVLRVIACLSVIMIHCSARYVMEDIGSFNFWIGNIFDSLTRIGVPIFVMISGTLMLDKGYKLSKEKLIKRIVKMILFFVFWTIIYCMIFNVISVIFIKHEPINIINVMVSLIIGHFHLWFIYLIIGLYLIVPLLRLWVNDKNKKYVEYFILLSIIFTYIIPQIISIGSLFCHYFEYINQVIEEELIIKYVGGYTTYFIIGWYISNNDLKHKKIIYLCGLIGLVITLVGTYLLSISSGKFIDILYSNLSINVFFQSIAIFSIVKDKFINTKNENNIVIDSISKKSLGIYALHPLMISIILKIFENVFIDYALISIPIIFILSFILSYICSSIFSKIPILKKFV